jgi:PQQ-like domain
MTDGPVIGAVTLVPGVVAVGEGTAIWLMATSDGHSLFKTWDTSTNSKYYGAPTIANGVVYIGNKNGKFYAYGGLAAPTPTPSPSITPSPTPTTLAQDTFHRANQTFWGTASDGQVWSRDANTQSSFSINNNMGQVSNGSGQYNALLGPTSTDAEVLFSGSLSSFTKSNLGAVLRWSDSKNWYKVSINGTSLMIQKKVSGTLTLLSKTAFTATAGTSYTLRFRVVGSTLSAKVWQTASTEPASWMITIADSSLLSGRCGMHLLVQSTVTADITSFLATKP